MDRYALGRRFKLSTGMTPHDYVVRCRLRRAMKLLSRTDRSIVDIALDVGCACQSHFTTMFRKCTGTTPGAFRLRAMASNSMTTRVGRYDRPVRNAQPPRFATGSVATAAANRA
jgi:AraC-like DNA-binding protein